MMKKSMHSLGKRICALVLGLWLMFAGLLTWAVARDFQYQISQLSDYWVSHMNNVGYQVSEIPEDTPGYESLMQIMHLGSPYQLLRTEKLLPIVRDQLPNEWGSDDWFYGQWDLIYGFQAATVFYDEAGEPLIKSGNLISLCYITEENWKNKITQSQGVAYIDLDALPQEANYLKNVLWAAPMANSPHSLFNWLIRATGYFEGDRFVPVFLDQTTSFLHPWETMCGLDAAGELQWENRISLEAPADVELVTIYAGEVGGITFDHQPVSIDGKVYDSLVEVALDPRARWESGNLLESVILRTGAAAEETGAATFRLAIHTQPLWYAFWRMIPVYCWGSLIIAALLGLLLRYIRRNLSRPLQAQFRGIDEGYPVAPASRWQEVREAEECLQEAVKQLHALQNDNQQLKTSLDYAKHAEENRRQLVSNITHELKTPLAVIHSYAEGLQAGIAEEKKEQYLNTILEEAEKMDAMVLQMLDLSRLEAGKVHLSADHFSLRALTEEILNKLAPPESREHTISFGICNDCMVTADEGRITQVVTNLISNALRYTPKGGSIWLQVYSDGGYARFQIMNSGTHLSEENLERIFESFYRADAARSERGTGLGLPIARNIIQLHRGRIFARNIWAQGESCLEFVFEIPLK